MRKSIEPVNINLTDGKSVCCDCGELLPSSKFFKSISPIFAGIGHLPICKDCLSRQYKRFKAEYNSVEKATQRICMMFDIYYDEAIVRMCGDFDESYMGNYIKRTNLGQFKGRTFDASIDEGFVFFDTGSNSREISENAPDKKVIEKWGDGLTNIDYEELEKHYKYLKSANPNSDNNQEIFIIDLCYIKMQQLKAVREGRVDDYNKLTESYRKSFQQAGLKTVRDMSATENFTIGVGVSEIEQYTPAEFYKDKKLYEDYDWLGDYFERFACRPLRNLQFGSDDRDYEFYVKDEDETDGYTEDE